MSVGEPTLSIQIIYSYLSRYFIPTNSVAPFFTDKLTHNPQFLHSHWRRANARNVNLETLYGDYFT